MLMSPSKKKSTAKKAKDETFQRIIDDESISDEQLLLDACPYPLIIGTIDGLFLGLNKAAEHIFQKTKKDLIGTSGYPHIELDAGERRRQVLHKMIEEKKPQILEDYERGTWWRTIFQPIFNKDGKVIKFAVIIHNISKEKNIEQEITEKNEEFWRRLIQYSNNSFFIIDKQGIIRYVSESVKAIIGFQPKEMIGKKIVDFFYKDDKRKAIEFFDKIINDDSIISFSHRLTDKQGKIRFMETTANNLLDNPTVRGIIITIRDITRIHKAQIETEETKKYLENIINSTSEIIFSVDTKGKVTLWNDRAAQITGFTPSSIIGKNIVTKISIQDSKTFKSYLEQCCRNPNKPHDVKIKTKHGDSRLLRIQGSPVQTADKKVKGVVFTGKDITSDSQIHGQLVTGASYLILDEDNSKAIDLLNGLLLDDYNGLFITRDVSQKLIDSSTVSLPVTQYYFSQKVLMKHNKSEIVSDSKTLVSLITDFLREHAKSIVLIDRLDYLIALHGFTEVMQTVYSISSTASIYDGVILIRLNPAVISTTELAILNEELKQLPEQSVENITIDNKLFDILQYVDKQNANKSLVSFKNIRKQFSITKVTTAKRINSLEEKDLVTIKKRGRLKTIYITDKGKRLLQRRNVV